MGKGVGVVAGVLIAVLSGTLLYRRAQHADHHAKSKASVSDEDISRGDEPALPSTPVGIGADTFPADSGERPKLVRSFETRKQAAAEPTAREPRDQFTRENEERPQNSGTGVTAEDLNLLDSTMRSQPLDSSAARLVREHLNEALPKSDFPGVSVSKIDCSVNLCRIDLESETGAVEGPRVIAQLATMAPHGGVVITTKPDLVGGAGKAVAFIAKEGTTLPHFER